MLIDVLHLLPQPHGVVGQGQDVGAALPVVGGGVEAGGGHVGGADGLDLLQLTEPVLANDLDGEREKELNSCRAFQYRNSTHQITFHKCYSMGIVTFRLRSIHCAIICRLNIKGEILSGRVHLDV